MNDPYQTLQNIYDFAAFFHVPASPTRQNKSLVCRHSKKHMACREKYKPCILKYKALILKYVPYIFCDFKPLKNNNLQSSSKNS